MTTLLVKVAVASLALAAVCWTSQHWLLGHWAQQAFVTRLGLLLATIVTGVAVFLSCGAALRIEELQELISAVRRRLHRSA